MKHFLKYYTQLILGLLFFVLITGCEKIELGEPFDCKVGIKYRIDYNLSFTIDSIRDYRCPKNVLCIWPGDVDIHLEIDHNFSTFDTILNLNTHDNKPFRYDGYDWEINKVEPYPEIGQDVDQSDYTVTFIITKN